MRSSTTHANTPAPRRSEGNIARDWWAPVWKGLVLDTEGKHYRRMGSAIWLFVYLVLFANPQTGSLRRKSSTVSRHTGIKVRTVRSWLRVLKQKSYIRTSYGGRSLLISIQKWKTYPHWHGCDTQTDRIVSGRVTQSCHPEESKKGQISAQFGQNSQAAEKANDITLKKYIFNDNVMDFKILQDDKDGLAREICQALNDEKNIQLYRSYVKKYPPRIIKRAFDEAIALPSRNIKKTRGALFTYLVKLYATKQYENLDHGH